MLTKQETFEVIAGIRATVVLGFVLREEMNLLEIANKIRGQRFGFERDGHVAHALDLTVLAELLEAEESAQILRRNFGILLKQALIRHTFELLRTYARGTGQESKFRQWPSYDFARLMRNIVSHGEGAVLECWSPKTLTHACWRHHVLTPASVGVEVPLEPADFMQLHEDMTNFLLTDLA